MDGLIVGVGGSTTKVASVEESVTYQIDLLPNETGATLSLTGDLTDLDCSSSGGNTFCQFKGSSNGTVDLKIEAGNQAISYTMYQNIPEP